MSCRGLEALAKEVPASRNCLEVPARGSRNHFYVLAPVKDGGLGCAASDTPDHVMPCATPRRPTRRLPFFSSLFTLQSLLAYHACIALAYITLSLASSKAGNRSHSVRLRAFVLVQVGPIADISVFSICTLCSGLTGMAARGYSQPLTCSALRTVYCWDADCRIHRIQGHSARDSATKSN